MRIATNCTYFVCQISTELRPWSHADCSMEFESIIHLYMAHAETCDKKCKHTGGVSCHACSTFLALCFPDVKFKHTDSDHRHSAVFDLALHYLPTSFKWDVRLILVYGKIVFQ